MPHSTLAFLIIGQQCFIYFLWNNKALFLQTITRTVSQIPKNWIPIRPYYFPWTIMDLVYLLHTNPQCVYCNCVQFNQYQLIYKELRLQDMSSLLVIWLTSWFPVYTHWFLVYTTMDMLVPCIYPGSI